MASRDDAFLNRLARRLAEEAANYARPKIPSETLRNALRVHVPFPGHSFAYLPHYWAVYVHDGRGPFGPVRSANLVWFRDPKQDPRLRAGVQVERAKDIKRLSKEEWEYWLEKNREAIKAGDAPPMIVTKFVKKPTAATNFFLNEPGGGMNGFVTEAGRGPANDAGTPLVREHILTTLKDVLHLTGSVTIKA